MAQPVRTREQASKVIDRAAKTRAFTPSLWNRHARDPQMRNPGYISPLRMPFMMERMTAKTVKSVGTVDVPLDKIRSPQATVSVAQVKNKIAGTARNSSRLPVLYEHKGTYYAADGNHRITAARAMNATTVKAAVFNPTSPGQIYGAMSPYIQAAGIAAAASTAYNEVRDGNGTRREALKAAGWAAAPGVATAATAGVLAKALPVVASGLAKFNPYVLGGTVAYNAVKGAWDGYNAPAERSWSDWSQGKPVPTQGMKGAAIGAAFGVADTLSFGLASYAAGRNRPAFESGRILGSAPNRLTDSQTAAFDKANNAYEGRQLQQTAQPAEGKRDEYKDTWSDSRGRNYTRRNMAVRTRQDMKEAA